MAEVPPEVDTSHPHPARIYDYGLGGKDHFAADRELANRALASVPAARTGVRENRAFLGRAVRYLAAEKGIRQFIEVIDFNRPVALLLVAVLHLIQDGDDPEAIVKTLVEALPPGSFVVASHLTGEHDRDGWAGVQRDYRAAGMPAQWRDSDEFSRLVFAGLEMVPPGAVLVSEWRPESDRPPPTPAEVSFYGGVARKS